MTWTSVSNWNLGDIEARQRLPVRYGGYYFALLHGRSVGYWRRPEIFKQSGCGIWVARARTRVGPKSSRYICQPLGIADDIALADGSRILSFEQAIAAAKEWFVNSDRASLFQDARVIVKEPFLRMSPVGNVYTVCHAMHDYIAWRQLYGAASYLPILISAINSHILPTLGTIGVDEFTGEHFSQFARNILETPVAPSERKKGIRCKIEDMDWESRRKRHNTINVIAGILRSALSLAFENGKSQNDRSWRAVKFLRRLGSPRSNYLSRQECKRLIAACREDIRPLVLGALYTGCRGAELLKMRVQDVAKEIYGVYVLPCKSIRGRFVFLPDEGMAFFLELAKDRSPNELLFTYKSGRRARGDYRYWFKEAIIAAELPSDFTFHGLRHTYTSQLVQAGTPLTVIADQLGHANTNMVSQVYGHLAPQIRESEVRQRFSSVDSRIAKLAKRKSRVLARLRKSVMGNSGKTYAAITLAKG